MVDDTGAGCNTLDARQKQTHNLQEKPLGFTDVAGSAKHQWNVMKVAQVGPPVYSLQPVETDGKTITTQFGIENKSGALAKHGSVQDHTGYETLIRVLTMKSVDYFEPYGLL
jgi:hypothetical protein